MPLVPMLVETHGPETHSNETCIWSAPATCRNAICFLPQCHSFHVLTSRLTQLHAANQMPSMCMCYASTAAFHKSPSSTCTAALSQIMPLLLWSVWSIAYQGHPALLTSCPPPDVAGFRAPCLHSEAFPAFPWQPEPGSHRPARFWGLLEDVG